MISLIVPHRDPVSKAVKMLGDELGAAANIKSRVNKNSVTSAITSTIQKLKLYNQIPANGLVIFCGTVVAEDGKEKRLSIDFEPFKPITHSVYLCDSVFHTEALQSLLDEDEMFGFIVMDGNGCLFATLQGNIRTVLSKFTVDLPKKHGRGGQSALRFARLRLEKRHNYIRKCAELAATHFLSTNGDNKCTVRGLVLAGSADFKTALHQSELFDPRLAKAVLSTLDISYGMEAGLNQAIELSMETLADVKLVQEKKLLQRYFDEIAQDTGKFCFQVQDTMTCLEMGAVETLIVWDNLALDRVRVRNPVSGAESCLYLRSPAATDAVKGDENTLLHDPQTNVALTVLERSPLVDWLAQQYHAFGANLEFVTDRSQEGSQFCRGFGGLGGMLRWKVDFDVAGQAEAVPDVLANGREGEEGTEEEDEYVFI